MFLESAPVPLFRSRLRNSLLPKLKYFHAEWYTKKGIIMYRSPSRLAYMFCFSLECGVNIPRGDIHSPLFHSLASHYELFYSACFLIYFFYRFLLIPEVRESKVWKFKFCASTRIRIFRLPPSVSSLRATNIHHPRCPSGSPFLTCICSFFSFLALHRKTIINL